MFTIAAIFLLGIARAAAIPAPCNPGEWSAWGECKPSHQCLSEPQKSSMLKTFKVEPSNTWDLGRQAMRYLMQVKENDRAEKAACIASGNCISPLNARPSSGPVNCTDGWANDLPCLNIDLLSFLNFTDMGYEKVPSDATPAGNDCWGWTDPLNGDEYAIMGLTGATTFVRITDAVNPVPVGIVYTQTTARIWRDIKVIGNYAYIVSEARNHGLQVFDLTRLRNNNAVETFQPDAVYSGFGSAHNIVANEETNFVYVVGATQIGFPLSCQGGLFVLDVSDPLNPTYAGCYGGDGYVHDAQCVIYHGPDTRYQGREVCFCYNEDTFTIVDVDDKTNMTLISKTGYANAEYTHQGWITEDHELVLLDDELDEYEQPSDQQFTKTYLWDVKDLVSPELKSTHVSAERSIDHNQYIIGDLTYQSNYESGLSILKINRESYSLSQVAYIDVFPSNTTAEFNGAWSVYPYFNSGNLIISSIDYGLFVVKPNYEAISKLIASNAEIGQRTRTRNGYGRETCPKETETEMCYADITC